MDDFVAYQSPFKSALLILGALGFVVLGLWMIGVFGPPPESHRYPAFMVTLFGWASVLFFGFCLVFLVKGLFGTKEQLRIGKAGIRWARWSATTIPWSEIGDVSTWSFKGQTSIILHLRDPALYPGSGLLAKLAGANRALTGGDIAISLTGTNRSFAEAMEAIERFGRR